MALECWRSCPPARCSRPAPAAVPGRPVAWLRPRRPRSRADQVVWAVAEAAALGDRGSAACRRTPARCSADDDAQAATALAALLPDPVDHVLIQADLTAVAPGPLESSLARTLQLLADVESRGGATVYRFTAGSVRRALDAGWSAVEVHDFIASVSRTPVPQPLTYLVDDTARTFGTVRVGHAEAFLRADDEAALTELLHHPKAGTARAAPDRADRAHHHAPPRRTPPRLRDLGAAPVVEAADGTVRVARPDLLRARSPRGSAARGAAPPASRALAQVVNAVRSGDRAAADRRRRHRRR